MIPLSLYIHFPWCIQKCPYCDFNSHNNQKINEKKTSQFESQQAYVEALIKDVDFILPYIWGRRISTIFIGGGTPSLMMPEVLEWLFSNLRARLNISPNAEITLEANPGTADQANFKAYREIGVNRLSIGVQSFNAHHLKKLGRIHNELQAMKAFEMAREAKFEQINLDIMFGLPNQTIEDALADLHQAIALNPEHLSYYQLTIEPNTYFYRYPPELPDDELIEKMQLEGQELLHRAGYAQYEVSAYARSNNRCLHNQNYWEFGDYIGIGAGAHGKITIMNEQKIYRTSIKKHPTEYMKNAGLKTGFDDFNIITKEALPFEFMLNTLRLKEGVPRAYWSERTFLEWAYIENTISKLVAKGLLSDKKVDQLCTTEQGFLFLNRVISEFIEM